MTPTLSLDPPEKLLRDCLADCAQTVPPLQIRFAGGWVRDKLLGIRSNDIDAALSTLSGKDFGQVFLEFYEKHGTKYKETANELHIGNTELNKIVLVEEDAEKSKHLAVAKMKLFGLEVDLVNLRTEVYASDSRTPVVEMGTAEEDALRRDATINALFYNIHTDQVEDFTGRGLEDMKNKIMRTPLDPYQTFRDDPLRVLRLIRFAARFDYNIDPAAQTAMKSPEIHQALKLKISRERVRIEIIKALEGPRPAKALLYIHNLGLFSSCFADPADSNPPSPPPNLLPQTYSHLSEILANDLLSHGLQLHQDSASLPWLLAAYTPWASAKPEDAARAIKEGLKATVREAKLLTSAISNRPAISALVSHVAKPDTPTTRSTIGMSLRRWGPFWGHQVLFALLVELQTNSSSTTPLHHYEAFLQHLQAIGLDGTKALDEKHLIDGRRIKALLDRGAKGGPANKFAADLVMEWQFDHPGAGAREVEECESMVRRRREEILGWEVSLLEGKGKAGRKRSVHESGE